MLYARVELILWAANHAIGLQAMNDNADGVDPYLRAVRLRQAFGQRLEERRIALGIALADAASALGTTTAALEAIESGHCTISPQELCLLCQLLQVDISWPFDEPAKQLSSPKGKADPVDQSAVTIFPTSSVMKRRTNLSEG